MPQTIDGIPIISSFKSLRKLFVLFLPKSDKYKPVPIPAGTARIEAIIIRYTSPMTAFNIPPSAPIGNPVGKVEIKCQLRYLYPIKTAL